MKPPYWFALALGLIALVSAANATTLCYQETANASTTCGGLATGGYFVTGAWNGAPSQIYDGNWSTYAIGNMATPAYVYVNYSKPNWGSNYALWRVGYDGVGTEVNVSINYSNCWTYNASQLQLRLGSVGSGTNVSAECYNGTWNILFKKAGTDVLDEEGIFWTNPVSNVSITQSSQYAFSTVNTSIEITINASLNLTQTFTIFYPNGTTATNTTTYNFTGSEGGANLWSTFNAGDTANNASAIFIVNSNTTINGKSTVSNASGTVYKLVLTNCSAQSVSQTPTINLTITDEQTLNLIQNSSIHIVGNATSVAGASYAFNINLTNSPTTALCVFPTNANYYMSFNTEYQSTGYTTRNFYAAGNFSNVTRYFSLYLLPYAVSSEVDFTVKDPIGNPKIGYTLLIQRYFIDSNSYQTVAQAVTDSNGRAYTYLYQPAQSYRIIVEDPSLTVVKTFDTIVIDASVQTGTIAGGGGIYAIALTVGDAVSPIYTQVGTLKASCIYNNNTGILSCTLISTTGTSVDSTMIVWNQTSFGWDKICAPTGTGAATTLVCSLPNSNVSVYSYQVMVINPDGSTLLIAVGTIDLRVIPSDWTAFKAGWGSYGFIATLLLVMMLFAIGVWNPVVALTLAGAGLIVSYAIGVFNVGWGTVVTFLAIIALLIWKSRA